MLMLAVILALSLGYRDSYIGKNREPLISMAIDSLRLIGRSARLRALFPALFLLFAGWTIAITYTPLAITALYSGSQPGTMVGIVLGAGGFTTLILSPLVGLLADRWGHWQVLFTGAGIAILLWPIPFFTTSLLSFGIAWALTNGLVSSIFAISFAVLSTSATSDIRGRVMSFAYLPMNVGFLVGPSIGSLITRLSIFAVFPAAAILTAIGIGVLWIAYRQPVQERASSTD
jgi:MFS family permease